MLIPIGLDQSEVRRLPWVSFAIIAVNIVVFLLTGMGGNTNEAAMAEAWERLVTYWQEHAYLEPPQALLDQNTSERAREEFKTLAELLRQMGGGRPPESAAEREQEQQELDRLTKAFLDSVGEHPFQKYGLKPRSMTLGAFLTCLFIHAGWLHLLGNMLIFYLSGPFVEDAFGRPLFLALYLTSGMAASAAHIMAFPGSNDPLGGASGAIAGVMGAFLVRYATVKIRFFYWLGLVFTGTFDAPAWLMLPLWLAQQLFFASMGVEGGTAYWAHVGGFVFGLAVALTIRKLKVEQRYIAPAIEKQISVTQHPAIEEGMALLAQGDARGARAALQKALAEDPRNTDAHLAMWHCCVAQVSARDGVDSMVKVIEDELKRGELLLALAHWRELLAQTGVGGPGILRSRLAAAFEGSDPDASREVLRQLASDASAGLLAEKAARKLAAMGETVAPPPPPTPEPTPEPGPEPIEFSPLAEAAPVAPWEVEVSNLVSVQESGLFIQGSQGGAEMLPFFSVKAIAVAGVSAQPRPFLVLDLVLRDNPGGPTRVVRLLSSGFDPRRLLSRPDLQPMAAFKALIAAIADGASAPVVPEGVVAEQARFTTYPSLEEYESAVLPGIV